MPFDDQCAKEYGLIRAALAEQGSIIRPNDMIIAAIITSQPTRHEGHQEKLFWV